jgi:peptidoglycan hydrolase-like protein with peptidoglycan-binding domain
MAMILQSVGRGSANIPSDVQLVQTMINRQISRLAPMRPLRVDGQVGPRTLAAIEAYQSRVVGMPTADGRVDPTGKTLKTLSGNPLVAQTQPRVQLGGRQGEANAALAGRGRRGGELVVHRYG